MALIGPSKGPIYPYIALSRACRMVDAEHGQLPRSPFHKALTFFTDLEERVEGAVDGAVDGTVGVMEAVEELVESRTEVSVCPSQSSTARGRVPTKPLKGYRALYKD